MKLTLAVAIVLLGAYILGLILWQIECRNENENDA